MIPLLYREQTGLNHLKAHRCSFWSHHQNRPGGSGRSLSSLKDPRDAKLTFCRNDVSTSRQSPSNRAESSSLRRKRKVSVIYPLRCHKGQWKLSDASPRWVTTPPVECGLRLRRRPCANQPLLPHPLPLPNEVRQGVGFSGRLQTEG